MIYQLNDSPILPKIVFEPKQLMLFDIPRCSKRMLVPLQSHDNYLEFPVNKFSPILFPPHKVERSSSPKLARPEMVSSIFMLKRLSSDISIVPFVLEL